MAHGARAPPLIALVSILHEAGGPTRLYPKHARWRHSADATRPCDVAQIDYMGAGVHLVLDASATCVFRNSITAQAAVQPGYAVRLRAQINVHGRRQLFLAGGETTHIQVRAVRRLGGRGTGRAPPCIATPGISGAQRRLWAPETSPVVDSWRELRPAALVAHWTWRWTTAKIVVAR